MCPYIKILAQRCKPSHTENVAYIFSVVLTEFYFYHVIYLSTKKLNSQTRKRKSPIIPSPKYNL